MSQESDHYQTEQLGEAVSTLDDFAGIEANEAVCEKCGAPWGAEKVQVCRSCGWYPSFGTFVEVDPAWDAHSNPSDTDGDTKPDISHLQVWIDLLPRWAWLLIGVHLALLIGSVAVRILIPLGDARTADHALLE